MIIKVGSRRINIDYVIAYYPKDENDKYSGIEVLLDTGSIVNMKATELNNDVMLAILDNAISIAEKDEKFHSGIRPLSNVTAQ